MSFPVANGVASIIGIAVVLTVVFGDVFADVLVGAVAVVFADVLADVVGASVVVIGGEDDGGTDEVLGTDAVTVTVVGVDCSCVVGCTDFP